MPKLLLSSTPWVALALALACSSSTTNEGSGGGSSSGGGGGAGGSSVGQRCDAYCTELVKTGCPASADKSSCQLYCKAMTSDAVCDATTKSYFDCTEQGTFTCNAADEAVVDSCSIQYLNAVDCVLNQEPDPVLAASCDQYCGKVIAAGCLYKPEASECKSNCRFAGATGIGCNEEWSSFLACANAGQVSCVLGIPTATGCGTEWKAFTSCVDAAS